MGKCSASHLRTLGPGALDLECCGKLCLALGFSCLPPRNVWIVFGYYGSFLAAQI